MEPAKRKWKPDRLQFNLCQANTRPTMPSKRTAGEQMIQRLTVTFTVTLRSQLKTQPTTGNGQALTKAEASNSFVAG